MPASRRSAHRGTSARPLRRAARAGSPPSCPWLTPAQVQRLLTRLARAIAAAHRTEPELVLIGIQTGGVQLARHLARLLARLWRGHVTLGQLDVTMHRDDLDHHLAPRVHPTSVPVDLNQRVVILVDDVLSSGRTVRAALDALHDLGRPRCVQLAVLVERPHRVLPICADYVGTTVRTAATDQVEVQWDGDRGPGQVWIHRAAAAPPPCP